MKNVFILIIGVCIGIGSSYLWQLRLYEPKKINYDGTIESSYGAFIESLVKSGEFVQSHKYYSSDREKAQAYIHILSSLINMIKQEVINDHDFPYFNNLNTFTKTGMDNADQTYHQTFLDGSGMYRVWGKRGSSNTISFTTYLPDTLSKSLYVLDDLKYNEDGSFEIILGGENDDFDNWMPLENDSIRLLVRQTLSDWNKEMPGTIHIDRIDKEKGLYPIINTDTVSENLLSLANEVLSNVSRWPDYHLKRVEQLMPLNSISKPRQVGQTGGLSGRLMSVGHFNLQDDQVLIIKAWPTDSTYQGIQLGNPWWQSLDYANRVSSLTLDQSKISSDGAIYYLLSTIDPGYYNWLDIEDFNRGVILMRYDGLKNASLDEHLYPSAQLININDLDKFLPSDEELISKDERMNQILNRRKHVQKRFNY
tara:strand:- start:2516 stop:3784 length:1269 start_codon:yes stop_codon:yes gene_type:complete